MKLLLEYSHVIVSILLILSILSQNRSSGMGAALGGAGGGGFYAGRRGAEKVLFYSSIVLSVLFVGISVGFLFV